MSNVTSSEYNGKAGAKPTILHFNLIAKKIQAAYGGRVNLESTLLEFFHSHLHLNNQGVLFYLVATFVTLFIIHYQDVNVLNVLLGRLRLYSENAHGN